MKSRCSMMRLRMGLGFSSEDNTNTVRGPFFSADDDDMDYFGDQEEDGYDEDEYDYQLLNSLKY